MGASKKDGVIPRAVQGTVQLRGDVDGRNTGCVEFGTRSHYQRRAENVTCVKRCSNGSC